jgi:hypothetical protein
MNMNGIVGESQSLLRLWNHGNATEWAAQGAAAGGLRAMLLSMCMQLLRRFPSLLPVEGLDGARPLLVEAWLRWATHSRIMRSSW